MFGNNAEPVRQKAERSAKGRTRAMFGNNAEPVRQQRRT